MNTLNLFAAVVVNGNSILVSILWIVIAALIYFVLMWAIEKCGIPEPFHKIAVVLVVVVTVVALINGLLGLLGHAFIVW